MKRFINPLLALTLLFICSCNANEIENDIVVNDEPTNNPFLVNENDACKSVLDFVQLMSGSNQDSRSGSYRISSVKHLKNEFRSESSNSPQGVYIVNFDNNRGYAIASADKRDNVNVYLLSETGSLSEDFYSPSSPISYIKELIEEYQTDKVNNYVFARDPSGNYEYQYNSYIDSKVDPLLKTCWHQGYPFNSFIASITSNISKPVGCVPLALGQIFSYYKHPNSFVYNNETTVFDWNNIATIETGNEINETGKLNVSKLLYLIGITAKADYFDNAPQTEVKKKDIRPAIKNFGYSCSDLKDYNINTILHNLNQKIPVFMLGRSQQESGHAWVVDGYHKVVNETIVTDINGNIVDSTIFESFTNTETLSYIHINFGNIGQYWDACYNRTYVDALDNLAWTYSDIFKINGYEYNSKVQMITDIQPNK